MTGIGPEFLRILTEIEWDTLTARDAVQLRAALQQALAKSTMWFGELSKDFGQPAPAAAPIYKDTGRPPENADNNSTAPSPVKAPSPPVRRRGRPTKVKARGKIVLKARPAPLAIGGADAATEEGVEAAKLFENSYVSKEGPRQDIPATLPANHPRRGVVLRESSVTPEVDMSDFATVENAMRSGKGLKDVFQ